MKKTFLLFFLAILLVQCRQKNRSIESYNNIEVFGQSDIIIQNIEIDSIVIKNIPSSFSGKSRVFGNLIYFIDNRTNRIFPINKEGLVDEFYLGSGRGPKEYQGGIIYDFLLNATGEPIVLGTSWDIHLYDQHWERKSLLRIDWQDIHGEEERLHNPHPDMPGLYSLTYDDERDKGRILGDYLFFEIASQHPEFNMVHSRDYYRNGRIIAKINYHTGVVENILGVRSPVYENYEFIGQFSRSSFDADPIQNQFFLSFQSDSLIYICDENFMPISAFGRAGRNVNMNYTEYSGRNYEIAKGIFNSEIKKCGYYEKLEYIEQRELLFRMYRKGSHDETDGMQIYRNKTLVADLDVPKGFEVIGYIEPYFITNILLDAYNEKGVIYKFKLDL